MHTRQGRQVPHVVEKIVMLKGGVLKRGIDIFDLLFHLAPTGLLIPKIIRDLTKKRAEATAPAERLPKGRCVYYGRKG